MVFVLDVVLVRDGGDEYGVGDILSGSGRVKRGGRDVAIILDFFVLVFLLLLVVVGTEVLTIFIVVEEI